MKRSSSSHELMLILAIIILSITGTIDALLCDKEADKVVDRMYTEISR